MTAEKAVLRLITFTLFVASSARLPQPDGCSPVLVAFSPCLPSVSAPPNDMAETVPSQCCDAVNSAFNSGHGDCLCEPLLQPLIFGFPLNETRLRSLSSVCDTSGSLESICSSGSSQLDLPPLHGGTTDLEIPKPPDSGGKQPVPFPSDSGEPQLPIPKPPDSDNQPHLPIPKPSDNQPQLPIPEPSGNGPQLPIPNPSDNYPQLPSPPALPLTKPTDSGQLPHLPLLPFHGATGPEIPKPFDPGHDNASAQTTSSPTTPSSSVIVSRGSIATTQIFKSNSWFLPGILISLLVFIHT